MDSAMKHYIEIKYSKHVKKQKETIVVNIENSVSAIVLALKKASDYDPFCEISEITVRTKP
jgi:bisphosphoglycerate-dependent phosphoglycerate mutase